MIPANKKIFVMGGMHSSVAPIVCGVQMEIQTVKAVIRGISKE